ncbi:MAG: GTPase [Deltaproteobacteria bacterium HGW-Deltaproteobacteria-14]|jgi:predicted GTPase|nr:MAG: GTPase [Deltaproteobacteria bacterium HGW-Deltaproteobacteria-14]
MTFRCIVMGAAGRDFHDFQTFFRSHPDFRVVCFTAEQIPFIDQRKFPRSLAGPGYAEDIPIYNEGRLVELIREHQVEFVFLSYSDLPHAQVMHKASIVQAAGASFVLLGPDHTMLQSSKPVIAVTAVRTGAGKSPISQLLAAHLGASGRPAGVLRHPMPYGDLERQRVQRFATAADLDSHECTVEEREEYAPYVERGLVIFAGVDYASILAAAEAESDVILWDGGNNDTPFVRPTLWIAVLDALRPGHEVGYYPGETNYRAADVLVVNKVDQADPAELDRMLSRIAADRPDAALITADLGVVADEAALKGKRVLVIEDGPTTTHGGMAFGAGYVLARRAGAAELVDPRPFAVGSIARTLEKYPHITEILPAMGYSDEQRADLAETVRRAAPDVVVDASPARVGRLLGVTLPVVEVDYHFVQRSGPDLLGLVDAALAR